MFEKYEYNPIVKQWKGNSQGLPERRQVCPEKAG